MAEGKEIIIRIVSETGDNNKKADVTGEEQEKSTDDVLNTALMYRSLKKMRNQIFGITVNETKYQLNKYFMLTDDYLGQQSMNIGLNIISKAWNFGTSIYAGAKVGASIGGGWGAVIGAVLAAGTSLIQTTLEMEHNYEQERIKLNQMDAQLSFNRQRAGYSLTAGSIGENR